MAKLKCWLLSGLAELMTEVKNTAEMLLIVNFLSASLYVSKRGAY